MTRVLITGAFGNLGLMCIDEALKQGFAVHCFDIDTAAVRKKAQAYQGKVQCFFGDIQEASLLEKALTGVDAIIHNASLLPPMTELKPELAYQVNVVASLRLIEMAQEKGIRMVYPSSFTVFEKQADRQHLYTADDAVKASDNYTAYKLEVEQALKNSSIDWVIVRIAVSVDARTLKTDRKTFKQLLAVKADNPLEYVHPKDIARALCRAAEVDEALGKILLLGGGSSCQITQHQFFSIAFKAFGLTLDKALMGNNDYYTRWLDSREAEAILQFQQHTIADYEQEMMHKLRFLRLFIKPLAPLLNPLLPCILKRL